jgi:hypothetical protein
MRSSSNFSANCRLKQRYPCRIKSPDRLAFYNPFIIRRTLKEANMSHSSPDALQQRCQHIVTSPVLTPEQKRHFLALEAENNLPYPALPEAAAPRWTRVYLRHVRRPCALQTPLRSAGLRKISG